MTPRTAGFLVVALLVTMLATQSAVARPQPQGGTHEWTPLQLSRHGHHWSSQLRRPLFGRHLVLVPGRTVKRTFFVRNRSGEQARLRLGVRVTHAHGSLQRDAILMAVRTRSGWWHHVRRTGSHPVAWRTLRKGAVIPVTVRVRIRPRADNTSMDRGLRFRVGVRLSQRTR